MSKKNLSIISYLYLIVPVLLFFTMYLKIYISIPLDIGLIIILYRIVKNNTAKDLVVSKRVLLVIFLISIIVCITAGIGNIFYQSSDWHWRNAIFRDMINKPWPVYYKSMNATLCYYIGIWILPALFGKLFLGLGSNVAFTMGNIALLIYAALGLTLITLWIINTYKTKDKKKIIISILVFFLFSGLDIIGLFLRRRFDLFHEVHLEWWSNTYQFSSIITQLFWVFNQSIVAWLITWMYLNEKKLSNYFLLIILALPYSPLPFCGLIILFLSSGIKHLIDSIKNKNVLELFKEVFSIQNVLAILVILPIYFFFYRTNGSVNEAGFRLELGLLKGRGIIYLMVFWILEVGIYYIILFKKYKSNYLFHVAYISLIFIPLFRIGNALDFSMRASIPSMIVCIYFIIDYIINNRFDKISKIIVIIFIFGMITPGFEYLRAVHSIRVNKKINNVADKIKTFEDKDISEYTNFISPDPEESIFYKYLARDIKEQKNDKRNNK